MVAPAGSNLGEAQTLADALAGPGPFAPIVVTGKYDALEPYHNIIIEQADPFLLAALGVGSYVDELS